MSKDTSGSAFPVERATIAEQYGSPGMSLRQWYAGLAMQGFAANPEATWRGGIPAMAEAAFEWADAMIVEGSK